MAMIAITTSSSMRVNPSLPGAETPGRDGCLPTAKALPLLVTAVYAGAVCLFYCTLTFCPLDLLRCGKGIAARSDRNVLNRRQTPLLRDGERRNGGCAPVPAAGGPGA